VGSQKKGGWLKTRGKLGEGEVREGGLSLKGFTVRKETIGDTRYKESKFITLFNATKGRGMLHFAQKAGRKGRVMGGGGKKTSNEEYPVTDK